MCKCTWTFSSIKMFHFLPSVFSPFWGENFLVGSGRKHTSPTIYFPSFSPNQTHSKKVLLPIFSPKFSIHSISPPNKHTLRVLQWSRHLFNYWKNKKTIIENFLILLICNLLYIDHRKLHGFGPRYNLR